jgi:putative flippase GtrA
MQPAGLVTEERIAAHGRAADLARRLSRLRAAHLAGVLQIVSFAVAGALGTLVSLACVWLFAHQRLFPYIVYITIATEMSTLANFGFNDRVTFRSLARNGHPWMVRCLRFHSAVALGLLLTIGVSTGLHNLAHLEPIVAQLAAIVAAAGVNFTAHRMWTYRRRVLPDQA